MSHGIDIKNDANYVIIDDTYAQMTLALTGVAAATWVNNQHPTGLILFPSYITYPLVFVRPRALNSRFYVSFIDYSGFKYSSDGPMDYIVYNMIPPSFPVIANGDMGAIVKSVSGSVLFDSRVPPRPIIGVYTSWEESQSPSYSLTTGVLLRNIPFVGSSLDGGLPYVSASSLSPAAVFATSYSTSFVSGHAGMFTSTSNLGIYTYNTGSGGSANGASFHLVLTPRQVIIMR